MRPSLIFIIKKLICSPTKLSDTLVAKTKAQQDQNCMIRSHLLWMRPTSKISRRKYQFQSVWTACRMSILCSVNLSSSSPIVSFEWLLSFAANERICTRARKTCSTCCELSRTKVMHIMSMT